MRSDLGVFAICFSFDNVHVGHNYFLRRQTICWPTHGIYRCRFGKLWEAVLLHFCIMIAIFWSMPKKLSLLLKDSFKWGCCMRLLQWIFVYVSMTFQKCIYLFFFNLLKKFGVFSLLRPYGICHFAIYSSALRPLTLTAKIRTRWMKNVHLWICWQRDSVVQCFLFRRRISLFYANETRNLSKCNWRNTSNKIKSTCMNIEHAQRDRSQERHANCFMSIFMCTFYSHRCFKQFVTEKSVHIL